MEITRTTILEMLYASLDQLNEQRSPDQQLAKSPETVLLGDGGNLESLDFVNLVVAIEETCQDRLGKTLILTELSNKNYARDPFATVGSLAEFIELTLTGRADQWR
jgi:acyl carrier protein